MNIKKASKITIDILMYLDFIFLMSHGVVRQLMNHAVFGIALFILFIVHNLLNLGFYRSSFKGRYNGTRILFSVTNLLLFTLMILMAVSSILMSGAVFEFSTVSMSQFGRTLHTASSSWGYIVMSFHLGLHLYGKLERIRVHKIFHIIIYLFAAGFGVFASIKSQIYVFLFFISGWKMAAESLFLSYMEYLGITLFFIVAAFFVRRNIPVLNLKTLQVQIREIGSWNRTPG